MWPKILVPLIVVLIVGCAVAYIVREKKKGRACIGCPYAGECHKKCSSNAEANTATSDAPQACSYCQASHQDTEKKDK